MSVDLLTPNQQWIAFATVIGCIATILIGRRRWQRYPAVLTLCSLLLAIAGTAILGDFLVSGLSSGSGNQPAYNEHRWMLMTPFAGAILWVAAGVGLVILILGWIAARRLSSPWARALVMTLRTGSVACAMLLFVEPALELREVTHERNHIAVVVDSSASMALRDEHDGPTRFEQLQQATQSSQKTFLEWRDHREVDFYEFSDSMKPTSEQAISGEQKPPTGKATRIHAALSNIRQRYQADELAGVVLLSDGIDTGKLRHDPAGAMVALKTFNAPVHTVWVGGQGLKDVAIERIFADEFAFARTVVKIDALVRSTGFGPRRIPVTLSKDGAVIRTNWIEFPDTEMAPQAIRTTFEFTPDRVGKYVYEVSTPVTTDESSQTNNSRSTVLRVIRDKIRVLLVAGRPSWDVHALRRMLKHNPNVDLVSFFILRTGRDTNSVPSSEMSLIPFPTRELFEEQLPSFDAIILQNFEYAPYGIGTYLQNIHDYVYQGGALAMVGGGHSFASGRYTGTPIARLLP